MQWLSFMCLLWLVPTILAAGQCGCPGTLAKGTVDPLKRAYNEGELVTYTCDRGYYFKRDSSFFKKAQRTCQDTGFWNGTIPACDYYDVISNASITPITPDERNDTCAQLKLPWGDRKTDVKASFKTSYTGEIQIFVRFHQRDLLNETTMSVWMDYGCSPASIPLESGRFKYRSSCNTAKKTYDQTVTLSFSTRPREKSVSICSLKGLMKHVTTSDCEELDCPAYGTVSRLTSPYNATYYCDEGYEILGEPQRECEWSHVRGKYFWFGTAPVCAPIKNNLPSSTSLALIIIAVIITIFNILYCLVRYSRKKLTPTGARSQIDVNQEHIYQNQEMRIESEVLPLNNLSRDEINLSANNGRCSMNDQNTYAEIGEFAVFSTAQSTTAQHLSKNKEPYVGATEGGKANAKIPVQQHSTSIDSCYASLNSNTKKNPANANASITHYFKNDEPYAQVRKSGKSLSDDPEPSPRNTNKNSDYSEPFYHNILKKK